MFSVIIPWSGRRNGKPLQLIDIVEFQADRVPDPKIIAALYLEEKFSARRIAGKLGCRKSTGYVQHKLQQFRTDRSHSLLGTVSDLARRINGFLSPSMPCRSALDRYLRVWHWRISTLPYPLAVPRQRCFKIGLIKAVILSK